VVLLLMWVHVQRVPKAKTMPPRPVTIGLAGALLALSLAVPALSQGGAADLAQAVATVRIDWFYLPMLPFIARAGPTAAWIVLAVAGVLAVLLPWSPHRRRSKGHHQVAVAFGDGGTVNMRVREDETLLDAGLREGLPLPYQCRNGACGVCVCSLEPEAMRHVALQPSVLGDSLSKDGKALMCCAVPIDDLTIHVEAMAPTSRIHSAKVVAMERLAPDVMRLRLAVEGGERIPFRAGQYIDILLDDGQRRAFSFANAPQDESGIELHVRRIPGGRYTTHVFEGMRVGDVVRFEGPLGRFALQEGERPILFVAGATGFAPVKSILEDAFARGLGRPMRLYWGARRPEDLYLLPLVREWEREHANFEVIPVVSEPAPDDGWTGRTGLVHEALLADHANLSSHEMYVCGSLRMVDAALPSFLARGLDEQACFSDAFVPSA
jgi:CDP-4-dehydro-6-deoxyglucose reductase